MQEMGGVWLANLLGIYLVVCSSMGTAEAKSPPPRKKVVIAGSVNCVYCVTEGSFPGSVIRTALLPGAVVKLQCNNTNKGSWEEETKTDDKGDFSLKPVKVTSWGAHKCKVFLVSSPRAECPVVLYSDTFGAVLKPAPPNTTSPFQLFTLPPLYFFPGPYMCV